MYDILSRSFSRLNARIHIHVILHIGETWMGPSDTAAVCLSRAWFYSQHVPRHMTYGKNKENIMLSSAFICETFSWRPHSSLKRFRIIWGGNMWLCSLHSLGRRYAMLNKLRPVSRIDTLTVTQLSRAQRHDLVSSTSFYQFSRLAVLGAIFFYDPSPAVYPRLDSSTNCDRLTFSDLPLNNLTRASIDVQSPRLGSPVTQSRTFQRLHLVRCK